MSATADKARYFLEQSVPELKEYERKKLFSPDEITSIAKKRSDFEHKINARGSAPSDYAQYAEFEINVEALRRKRVKRLGVKFTSHNGQRRIYFIFDRGTRKFPGDIGLWMESIEFARRQKAYKKLMQMFTNVLRLHPAKSALWIYAAQFAIDENGDMTEARSYMQRGLRFCKNCQEIWLEYTRLELAYMAKIHARRQILGIGEKPDIEIIERERQDDENLLLLPDLSAIDNDPGEEKPHDIDPTILRNLDNTPIMSGAIPLAIFDAAMSQFQYDGNLAQKFFVTFVKFCQLPQVPKILDHLIQALQTNAAGIWQTHACYISQPLVGKSHNQPDFPAALRQTIARARDSFSETNQKAELMDWYKIWLKGWMDEDMDAALKQVISAHLLSIQQRQLMA